MNTQLVADYFFRNKASITCLEYSGRMHGYRQILQNCHHQPEYPEITYYLSQSQHNTKHVVSAIIVIKQTALEFKLCDTQEDNC